tara:strand:- start:5960 stop:7024 length:1065 start_codon:yes stop_codon:yes gene_type:complete
MKSNSRFFKKSKSLPVDKFFNNVLYDKKFGYYCSNFPFGKKGDFITAPKISNLFSEMIAIWMISTWEIFKKPENFNIVELGPGDGSLTKNIINVFKRFPEFNSSKNIFLLEKSELLKKLQKKNINDNNVRWIKNYDNIKKGPIIFFGNEFLDAIPIKQFKRKKKDLLEKYYVFENNSKIKEKYKKISIKDMRVINSYKTLSKLKFIEFPKDAFKELKKISKKILKLNGCLLLVDYGYLKSNNQNTLQSVRKHKKNHLLKNLGKSDVTSHINFSLLNEFLIKNRLKVKETITQEQFLKNMGIIERAEMISKKMKFSDQSNLYLRLKRLLSPSYMGTLFKVSLSYNCKYNNFFGFK